MYEDVGSDEPRSIFSANVAPSLSAGLLQTDPPWNPRSIVGKVGYDQSLCVPEVDRIPEALFGKLVATTRIANKTSQVGSKEAPKNPRQIPDSVIFFGEGRLGFVWVFLVGLWGALKVAGGSFRVL